MNSTLNIELLASMIKTKRGKKGLRDTANEIKAEVGEISSATLSRIEQGKLPDVETFIKICRWLNMPTDAFITGEKRSLKSLSTKDQIIYQLRSSQELDEDTINAMVTMMNIAFKKKKNSAK
jgi:transcriptional regulator with XRE-family HTH domain